MIEEWGPWIEHDGKGCPCVGQYVHVQYATIGRNPDGTLSDHRFYTARGPLRSWIWSSGFNRVIRYRIRKPRGLTILENLISDLPAPVGPKVDA